MESVLKTHKEMMFRNVLCTLLAWPSRKCIKVEDVFFFFFYSFVFFIVLQTKYITSTKRNLKKRKDKKERKKIRFTTF